MAGVYVYMNGNWVQVASMTDTSAPVSRAITLVSSSDAEYTGYPYKYSFAATGATSARYAYLTFLPEDADSGNLASICETGSGVIYFWSKEAQTSPMYIGYSMT